MTLDLPQPVSTYLASDQAKDADLMASVFAEDAHVHDEAHDYYGKEAIKKWRQEAQKKYQYTIEPLEASTNGNETALRARLSGNFPGSPVEVTFTFVVANNYITSLNID